MKKNMLLLAWLMAAGMPVLAQNAYLENLKLENRTVEKADGKVRVQADICLDGVDLKRHWCPYWCRPTARRKPCFPPWWSREGCVAR